MTDPEHATLTSEQTRFLRDVFPGEDCLLGAEQTLVYGADAGRAYAKPLAVVRPREQDQVVKLLAWAQEQNDGKGMPLYPRARGTNLVGACTPHKPGLVVSTLKMDRIQEINDRDFVAVVQPGVVTADFQQAVAEKGLFYPPDPASLKISTLGGNVSTCAGGMRAVKYGVTRDYVLGLTAVLPGGEVINPGGRCHKNVVGLDLTRLFVGSEGTLGFITELKLKLLPLPENSASLLAGFPNLDAAMDAVTRVFGSGLLPSALEFMGQEVLDCLALIQNLPWPRETRAALLFRLDGAEAALLAELDLLKQAISPANPCYTESAMGDDQEKLWEIRRLINPASYRVAPGKLSDDLTVPRGSVGQALKDIRGVSEKRDVPILTFGHLGDGNLHVNIMHDPENKDQRARALAAREEVMDAVLALSGTLSGEHGVGLAKRPYLDRQLSPLERELMARVKAVFDPKDIMNPGKAF